MLRQTRLLFLLIIVAVGLAPGYWALSASDAAWAFSRSPDSIHRLPITLRPWAQGIASTLDDDAPYVAGRLLVQFSPGTPDEEKAAVHERLGAQVVEEISALDIQILQVPEEATSMVFAYQAEPSVNFAEPDYIARIAGWPDGPILSSNDLEAIGEGVTRYPNDPRFPDMWNLAKIRAEAGWDITTGRSDVIIAVIDTGADASHPDLQGKLVPAYDFVNNDSDPADDQGHGTHVAGTAAAVTNNGIGIAGVSWGAKVMPVKALSANGSGAHSWIANGIVWATDHGADVINMSLGGPYTSATMSRAVDYAWSNGVVIVAAAGNGRTSNPTYPAAYDDVIGVSATTQNDERAEFSNYGSYISVASPGVSILSSTRGGGYQAWSGTSMASPHVAGLAALIKSIHPNWTNAQIREAIESSAVDFGTPGWDAIYGWGRIDIFNALSSDAPTPTDTPTPTPTPTATPVGESILLPDLEQPLIDAINQQRAAEGLPPLHRDERLMQAARRHGLDMADNELCSHTGSDGSNPFDRIGDSGYPMASGSEVIACGYQTPDDVVQGWWNSPPHRIILTSESYVDIGCGVAQAPSRTRYWACNPARPNDFAPPSPTTVTPSATPVPVTNTPTPSPTPTRTSAPGPTDPVNPETVYITPEPLDVGWVASNEAANNHFSDDDIYAGIHGGQVYIGAMQFNLSQIPPGSKINWARLTITGQTRDYTGDSGSWSVSLLGSDIDANWRSHGYLQIRDATGEYLILPILANTDLQRDKENIFNLDGAVIQALERRLAETQRVSLRVDGPINGPNNLFSWDSGYGVGGILKAPVLTINYTSGQVDEITPTPTPTISPTTLPGDGEVNSLDLIPDENSVGWVVSNQPGSNEFGDDDLYAGVYTGNIYMSGIQFDLSPLPADAEILDAELRLTGQTRQYLSGAGTWVVEMLTGAIDAGWPGHGYTDIANAATAGALQDVEENDFTLEPDQLDVDRVNVLGMTDTLLGELITRRGSTGHVSFRIQGPKAGNSNTFSWDTGYGIGGLGKPPILHIEYRRPGGPGPTPTPTLTATPMPPTDDIGVGALISAINEARSALSLPALRPNDALMRAAEDHSRDLADNNRWSHTGSDGSTPQERMRRAGYPLGDGDEALAGNSIDIDEIVTAWTRNTRHYAMLMSRDYVDIGAGHAYNPASLYGDYWTLLVARPAEGGGPPGDFQVQLTPRESKVGWVVSDEPNLNHFGDDDMYAGFYNALIYVGAVQFDLASVPDGAQITGAMLQLMGQTDEYLVGTGTWMVHMLDSAVDFDWASHGYRAIADASSIGIVGDAMEGSDLGVNHANELSLSEALVAQLADRMHSTGLVSFRIDGPKSGASDVFSWDSGYGVGGLSKPPVLTISYSMP
ncbi:MAG: S8 family serine peptidase [Anaerolineae bacterium]